MRRYLRLAHDAGSARKARVFVRSFLAMSDRSFSDPDSAVLVVNELVSNALMHTSSQDGPIGLSLALDGTNLHVEVRDHDPHPPRTQPIRVAYGHGRGLQVVEELAGGWNWAPVFSDGKRVWCDLDP